MQLALIVGGSRGLGLGLAREHLARGWSVTATERRPSTELAALARENPGRLETQSGVDILEPATVGRLLERLAGRTYDLLFLNAGIMAGRGVPLTAIPDHDIAAIFATNAVGPIRAADMLMPLVAPGGTVAFMSSVLGSVSTNDDGRAELYRASKAALNSLILSFRARHKARAELTVLALHPGVVRTSMGGPTAPLDIETSVVGVTDVLARRAGSGGCAFLDWRGEVVPW